jgi:tetratricopeptide (TPR) repeat protein
MADETPNASNNQSNIEIYKQSLMKVWEDGILTDEEARLLQGLQKVLNITPQEHEELEREVKLNLTTGNNETYRLALEQAWNDGVITDDEEAMLASLRKALKIPDELHAQMEAKVRQGLSSSSTCEPAEDVDEQDTADYWICEGEEIWKSSKQDPVAAQKAMECFDKAIDIDPLNYLAWSNKGLILKKLARGEDAVLCYDKAIEINPKFPNAWFNKGVLLGTLGKTEEAIMCLDQVLRMKPDHALAKRDREILLQIHGKKNK